MSQFETQILYGCFLLFDCERKSFYICLAFLQGSLHSLFFGEPHHHIACFTCIQLRGRLILWRENPVFVRELDLGLFPQQSCPSQLHIWQRDLWHGTYSCKFSFFLSSLFFFFKNSFLLSGLLCTKQRLTIYVPEHCPKCLSSILARCGQFCKHKALCRRKEFVL